MWNGQRVVHERSMKRKMKLNRRQLVLGAVALVLTGLGALVIVPVVQIVVFTKGLAPRAKRGRERLFLETDYEELLAACRELLAQMPSDTQEGRLYHVHLGKRDPETLTFPKVILDLEPSLIRVNTVNYGEVIIELFPGPDWFGVIATSEGHERRGDVRLTDGLWYFDTAYSDSYPEYVKRIDAMIEEGRRRKAQGQSVPALPQAMEQKP
jgi:hypothetical protein